MHGPRVAPHVVWIESKQVRPVSSSSSSFSSTPTRIAAAGFLYLVATGTSAVLYLFVLAPNVSNDNLWPNMNSTGVQTFLGDLYNAKLVTGATGPLDLFASSAIVRKDYSTATSFMSTRPAAARAVLLSQLPLDTVIHVMRAVPFSENIQTLSMPCWADLNRTYEMGHTARHQALCNARRPANAAFYLEALFRNLRPTDLATSTYLAAIETTIFEFIRTDRPGGAAWVRSLLSPTWLAVADELALWRAHGLEYFQNSFQNYYLEGTHESITIVNALGMHQSITVTSFTATSRPKTEWSSAVAYTGLWNDIDAAAWFQASLIRAAPNNFEIVYNMSWESWDFYFWGSIGTNGTDVLRSFLGPLTIFDVFLVPPPRSLLALVGAHQDRLHKALLANSLAYAALVEPSIDATPAAWLHPNAVYYGGNPVCSYGFPQSYVQTSFGYYDDCGTQAPHTIQLNRDSVLFAMWATGIQPNSLAAVCGLTAHATFATCLQTLTSAMGVFVSTLHDAASSSSVAQQLMTTTHDVVALNISFVQWATINGTNRALHQPMVSETTWDPWSFVGWMTMYEWVLGEREVYTFEGDWDIWTLMSCHHDLVPLAANTVELPQSACKYLWIVCIYVSLVLVTVLLLVLVYGSLVAQFAVDGRNLFFSNRLVGGSWIGRPFLFVRGMTAILILATSSVTFNSYAGFAKLDFTPRPIWHTLVLAGEAAWVTYVLNDILLPITKARSPRYAPLSSILTWLATLAIEWTIPYQAHATIDRQCSILSFTRGLECTNGDIHIGSSDRVAILALVAVASVPLAYAIVATQKARLNDDVVVHAIVSFHLTSSSEVFLLSPPNKLDVAACILSGLIPLGTYLFDVKNWIMFQTERETSGIYLLPAAAIEARSASSVLTTIRRLNFRREHQSRSSSTIRWIGIVGLLYMCGAVVSSFVYLFESQAYFTNDFLWLGFSDTNTQAFLVNWFNVQLQLANATPPFRIDSAAYGDYATTNNITQYNVFSSALYAIRIQDEANTLPNVIQSLRTMDSCKLPWIATAYCFADFDKTWHLAFSAERQQRCLEHEVDNGAVYLESILRNTQWPSLRLCWGNSLETSIFSPIQNSNAGISWVVSIKTPNELSVGAEVQAWQHKGITRFLTMWQNYKLLGVTESFLVSNYAGQGYPLTLKKSNSTFHLSGATAFKMYAPLVNYLNDAVSNSSILAGKSLVRATPSFAFANTTVQTTLLASAVLTAPLDPAYVIFYNTIGPFGEVDIRRVQPPQNFCNLYHDMRMFLLTKLSSSDDIQGRFWTMYTQFFLRPQPSAWDPPALMWGGDINCGLNFGGNTTFPLEYFSSNGLCGNYFWDYMKPYTQNFLMATLASGSQTPPNATAVSFRDVGHQRDVYNAVAHSVNLTSKYMSASEKAQFDVAALDVKTTIRDVVQLEMVQYLSLDGTTFTLSRVNVFASTEVDFEVFAWLYLFEWVEGKREVISVTGALDTLTTMSTTKPLVQELTNAIEIPQNVGRFFYAIIFYVTTVLFGVGCLVTMYIVSSRGYVDGINVIAFNYVAGHVWIGRPLMFLRSLTSIALLSTSRLALIAPLSALTSYFQSPPRAVLTTLVSSGEICWLVYIVIDTLSIVTGEYTAYYSTPSVVVVSVSVAIWSFASPTTHSVELARQCTVVDVDFDISCISGIVRIGSYARFGGLIGVACGGCFAAYLGVRVVVKKPPALPTLSPLLYSAAKSEFEQTTLVNWEYDGVYYLDKASAAMTGIITITIHGTLYVADIKTWRGYAMPSKALDDGDARPIPIHIRYALPLDSSDVDN
ncbi:Aste57867_19943 [Aphanomyces stellatus]|uniref:Aste57867_19943 protein n=1 Tax=Aphanomyces stellatus TaxID=120398 RepID=A0A485LDV0_9STRA|nr:hypothetical protein As57867_019877 [Aphanomyces stellatus]VFT96640.1 Aste57867_19943 [Aphanomyces stellatus]